MSSASASASAPASTSLQNVSNYILGKLLVHGAIELYIEQEESGKDFNIKIKNFDGLMELVDEYNRRFNNIINTENSTLLDLLEIITESSVEDTTRDWDFAVSVQLNLDNAGQHTQSNRVESSQSNKEEKDPELAQAIRESKETYRVNQQARSVSAEHSCYCDDCLHGRAQNQCGYFICKLKRTVQIWRRRSNS